MFVTVDESRTSASYGSDYHLRADYSIWTMISPQLVFRQDSDRPEGLRSRKKARTRLAIEDSALALFEERGYDATTVEDIAERAEVSTTTFFRYFPSKAEVLLSDHGEQLPALHEAIIGRPAGEDDLTAVQRAVQQEWVAAIDPDRTARKARIVDSSDLLQGMSFHRGHGWFVTVSDALAERRGLKGPDDGSNVAARVTLGVLGFAVEGWIAGGCVADLGESVDHGFNVMKGLCSQWSKRRRT
jgi:AcrR family transcriptional regulator